MNIRDSESAFQEGRINFLEFQQEFMRVWYEPLYRAQLGALMASMSPEELLTPGMERVAPTVEQMLGGNNASASTKTTNNSEYKLSVPWAGSRSRPAQTPTPTTFLAPEAGSRS